MATPTLPNQRMRNNDKQPNGLGYAQRGLQRGASQPYSFLANLFRCGEPFMFDENLIPGENTISRELALVLAKFQLDDSSTLMAEDGNSSAEDENSSVDGEDIPENGGPWDGHIYQDVVATKEAKQANGDIGDRKKLSPRRSQFSSVKAKDKSKQVNGNMTLEAFEAFMK